MQVVEEEIDEELVAPDFEQHLAADECEARPKFQQELGDIEQIERELGEVE